MSVMCIWIRGGMRIIGACVMGVEIPCDGRQMMNENIDG